MDVYLARQPVYDRQMQVIAYELLYRAGLENSAGPIDDPDGASTRVLVNAFSEIGLDRITGGIPALINVTGDFITAGSFPSKLKDQLIPELLETIDLNDRIVASVLKLAEQGYRIALDDFVYSPEWQPLIDVADIIKLDVMALGRDGVKQQLDQLGKVKAKLLAEKVETPQEYDDYREMGFDYFQGFFFARPNVVQGKGVPANRLVVMALLSELNKPEADIRNIEKLICQDVRLSYKLLRVVNSAFFGLPRKIDSVGQTITLLGLNEIRSWAGMLSLSSIDDKPQELLLTAVVRGRMCQLLAQRLKRQDHAIYFSAGLFSLLDGLLDMHLEDVIEQMPLSDELARGVVDHEGPVGQVLSAVIAYEKGRWQETHLANMSADDLWDVYMESLEYAQNASRTMSSAA